MISLELRKELFQQSESHQGFVSYPCRGLWEDMWPALKLFIEPVALGVRELERTVSNLLAQVKLKV
jgi:hypothetical protein